MYTDAETKEREDIINIRNGLLEETNHWIGSGTAEQLSYRQALSDIEEQPNFPCVSLPVKPE